MIGYSSKWVIFIPLLTGIGLTHSTNSLDFSKSSLTEVPSCPMNQSTYSINLNNNNIEELFHHSFNNCDKLTKIFIVSNGLRIIHDGTFDNIHNLQSLILNHNNIVRLPATFGPSTKKLSSIYLVRALEDLRPLIYPYFSAFTGLHVINIISSSNGKLNDSFYPPNVIWINAEIGIMDTFPHLSSLTPHIQILAFAGHQLTTIPQEAVAGLFKLREIFLNKNEIRYFPNFSHCTKLTLLRFERNQLSYIPRQHVEGLESILQIHFNNNWLVDMTDISHLISLQQFFIGYNLITDIPVSFIEGLVNMKVFACNNNKLKSLPNISVFFPKLEKLYVQGNYLKTLPDLYEFPHLVSLQSAENPYECNISLCWLRMLPWLKPSVDILLDNPICDLPAAYTDRAVVRFHPALMECYNGVSLDAETVLLIYACYTLTIWECGDSIISIGILIFVTTQCKILIKIFHCALPNLVLNSKWKLHPEVKRTHRCDDAVVTIMLKIMNNRPLTRYVKLRVAQVPGTFFPPARVSDPDMHRGTCLMHVPRCMPGLLTSKWWWRCRHSRRMRKPQTLAERLNDTSLAFPWRNIKCIKTLCKLCKLCCEFLWFGTGEFYTYPSISARGGWWWWWWWC